MLKKFLAGILAMTMTFSFSAIAFGQETVSIDCELSSDDVQVGDIFYADFKITDNPVGYSNMQCFVDFDATKLQALECEVDDIPNDLIMYADAKGVNYSIFSFVHVNSRINFVPKSGDDDYLGRADSKTKAGELGRIKCANLLNDSVDGVSVNYEGTGTLLRMKFKAIAEGTSEIAMNDVIGGYNDADNGPQRLAFSVNNTSVTIGSGTPVEPDTETTTVNTESTTKTDATEVTTTASGGGSGSSGGSGNSSSSSATTTTEAAVEATTSAIIGGDDTVTDIAVISFTDVEKDFWAHDFIIGLAAKGVVNGYPDNSFKPQNNVTRADFLIMLLRGLGVDISKAGNGTFTDVEVGAYYANACSIAKDMGIATGNPDGSFNPTGYITRQDMMVLAKKAVESKLGSEITGNTAVLDKFNDKTEISPYAVDSLAAMVEAGIVNGKGDDIAPKANTTRAEAATIISMIIDYINK